VCLYSVPCSEGGAPQTSDGIFCSARKKILGRIGQLLRLYKCRKSVELPGVSPLTPALEPRWGRGSVPIPHYRFALRAHHVVRKLRRWMWVALLRYNEVLKTLPLITLTHCRKYSQLERRVLPLIWYFTDTWLWGELTPYCYVLGFIVLLLSCLRRLTMITDYNDACLLWMTVDTTLPHKMKLLLTL